MIKLKDVKKSYPSGSGRVEVLRGVDLEIPDGKLTVLSGASGSGKSTLLTLLSGLERPDSGSVCYGELELSALSDRELTAFRRQRVGFVFQQYYLLPHLTVEQNIRLSANLIGRRSVGELIESVGLSGKERRYPAELSGGEQQRVAVARAIAKNPEVLFLDEPTGALDEETGRRLLDYLSVLQAEKGFTAVMVTHNPSIEQMADVVLKLREGRIAERIENECRLSAFEIGW